MPGYKSCRARRAVLAPNCHQAAGRSPEQFDQIQSSFDPKVFGNCIAVIQPSHVVVVRLVAQSEIGTL